MGLDIFFHHSIYLIPITKKPILTVSYADFEKIGNIEICLLNLFYREPFKIHRTPKNNAKHHEAHKRAL
jgi:hypothetical protein